MPSQWLLPQITVAMSFAQFTQSSCGVPISNWDIAKQVGYGSLVSAAVILSIVFMIYMLCTFVQFLPFLEAFSMHSRC